MIRVIKTTKFNIYKVQKYEDKQYYTIFETLDKEEAINRAELYSELQNYSVYEGFEEVWSDIT